MSSVRRLKQKGIAATGSTAGVPHGDQLLRPEFGGYTQYDLRKAEFSWLPPATTVRPMRIVKQRVQAALEAVQRRLAFAAKAGMSFDQARAVTQPQQAEVQHQLKVYKQARQAADAGQGHIVHLAAA